MNFRTTVCLYLSTLCACTLTQDADAPFGKGSEASGSESEEPSTTSPDNDQPEPPPQQGAVANVCERIDECGFLLPGMRLNDCEDTTQMCLDDGLQSEVSDWELYAHDCLELENCFNFLSCYESLQICDLPLDVGTTGGFDGSDTSGAVLGTTTGALDSSTSFVDETAGSTSSATSASGSDAGDDGEVEPPTCGGACEACIDCAFEDPCAGEAVACASNLSCLDLTDCYAACLDVACYDLCDDLYPGGLTDYDVLTECILDECTSC